MLSSVKLNKIRAKLLQKGIKVIESWLEGCLEFFMANEPNMSDDQLFNEAYSQWLLQDLSDVGPPCLPVLDPGIQQVQGKFAVQMNWILDISESPYDQWREMQERAMEEVPEETQATQRFPAKKKRVFKLELTDGHTTVHAMEYQPIPALHKSLNPGTKLLITGPVQSSNKTLLLKPGNVSIFGGEVDSIIVVNAYENIIRKALNQPLNPSPGMKAPSSSINVGNPMRPPLPAQNTPVIEDDDDIFMQITPPEAPAPKVEPVSLQGSLPEPVTATLNPHPSQNGPSRKRKPSFDDWDVAQLIELEEQLNTSERQRSPQPSSSRQEPKRQSIEENFDEFDLMVYGNQPPPKPVEAPKPADSREYKFKIEGCNLLTFNQLFELPPDRRQDKTFIFLTETREIVQKLNTVEGVGWSIRVKMGDGSRTDLEVTFSADLMNQIIGYSAVEMKHMKQRAKVQPALKHEILAALEKFNDVLQDKSVLWKVQFKETPVVVGKTDLKPVYRRILANKVEAEKIEFWRWRVQES